MPLAHRHVDKPCRDPFGLDAANRDIRRELWSVAGGTAALIGLIVSGRHEWAVAWFMIMLFTFILWRIGRGEFR